MKLTIKVALAGDFCLMDYRVVQTLVALRERASRRACLLFNTEDQTVWEKQPDARRLRAKIR